MTTYLYIHEDGECRQGNVHPSDVDIDLIDAGVLSIVVIDGSIIGEYSGSGVIVGVTPM